MISLVTKGSIASDNSAVIAITSDTLLVTSLLFCIIDSPGNIDSKIDRFPCISAISLEFLFIPFDISFKEAVRFCKLSELVFDNNFSLADACKSKLSLTLRALLIIVKDGKLIVTTIQIDKNIIKEDFVA